MPVLFRLLSQSEDYATIEPGDILEFPLIKAEIEEEKQITMINTNKQKTLLLNCDLSDRQRGVLLKGGLLEYTKGTN